MYILHFFFFFQAEDGIRDKLVTGVQTCALPISFWRSGNPDLSRLLQNSVRWLRGDRTPPVAIEGDGLLEAFAWETEPGYALHLLNYTTPNLTWGLVERSYAIGAQRVARLRDRKSTRLNSSH